MLAPMYIAEVAPSDKRGMLVTIYQLAIVLGINLIYFVNLMIAGSGTDTWNIESGWRYMLGSEIIPALLFLVALLFVPESPRWLAGKKRDQEALDILRKVMGKKKQKKS